MNDMTTINFLLVWLLGACILFLLVLVWSMWLDYKAAKAELNRLLLEKELREWNALVKVDNDNESGVE